MFFQSSYNSMQELCNHLQHDGYLKSQSVYKALMSVDRADFSRHSPYMDSPQPIDYNVTISAPHMHAYCLELLKDYLKPGGKSLDVGFGSGYLTVAMSKMMNDQGTAVGIEHIKQLCDFATTNISKHHKDLLDNKKVVLICGDGRQGCAQYAPYNCIHVGAAAAELPKALVDQLANGGRLVIPIGYPGEGQYIYVIDKDMNGKITQRKELCVSYVPLTSVDKQLRGY